MNEFVQDFLNVITGQGAPDFNFILSALIIYLALLWLAFCAWVFMDAKKRYHSTLKALFISLVVFVLNFPALIFYLVVRPEDEHYSSAEGAGVEVPVVKFVDAEGNVKLALNLEIAPQTTPQSDMTVSVAWDSQRQDIELGRKKQKTLELEDKNTENQATSALNKVKSFGKMFKRKQKTEIEIAEK